MSGVKRELLWSSDRHFRVWSYGAGHSVLELRTTEWCERADPDLDIIKILFFGVSEMGLSIGHGGPVALWSVDQYGSYQPRSRHPRLLVEIDGGERKGFADAASLHIHRENQSGDQLECLFKAHAGKA